MYSIKIEGHFSSAHNLRGYKGKCESLHGHNWKVELEVAGDTLDKTGMLADFTLLKKKLHAVLETLDHKYLNEIAYFQKVNPTSENLTRFIYEKVKVEVKAKGIIVKAVTVWESENCCATYEE